jgi:hypothetical protein
MATVTGLTAARMQEIIDDTIVGAHIDGSGHLILEQFDTDEIDAGYMLASVPPASTIVQGIVELATSAETITGTDTDRAVTPAGLKAATDVINAFIAALTLNSLADVVITSAATGNVLQYNGSNWVNSVDVSLASAAKLIFGGDTNLYRNAANSLITDDFFTAVGGMYAFATINSVDSLTVQAFGDSQPKFKVDSTGKLLFGPGGSTAPDVDLYRDGVDILTTEDEFKVFRSSATANALSVLGGSDTNIHYSVQADGVVKWGPGNAAQDTNLYRSAANELKTDDSFVVAGATFTPPNGYLYGGTTVLYTTAGGTFSKASYPGLRAVMVHCYGPGGAGGGSTTGASGAHGFGSGGGSGGYSRAWLPVASLGTNETVTVGTGGTGVSAGTGNNGSSATSFGSLCVANAGTGGAASGTVTDARGVPGGAGASAGTSDSPALAGQAGYSGGGNAGLGWGGNGGKCPGPLGGSGGGGRASGTSNASLAGNAGLLPGGGGGGALSNSTGASQAGGAGGDGRCLVELYY